MFWVGVVKNWAWLGHGVLKLAVFQKGIDETNLFFVWCCNTSRANSCFNFFLMGMVKYECGHLGHETLSQLCLKNEPMNWAENFEKFTGKHLS